tara:strand:- start:92 stop:658 length:567 start_codon:yes stop_codon:yes gene_type:complete
MSDNPIIYTKDNHPSTPKEFMVDIFGENMDMWPTVEELVESARAGPEAFIELDLKRERLIKLKPSLAPAGQLYNHRIVADSWEPGDILFCYWHSEDSDVGNFWLVYVVGSEFWYKGQRRKGASLVTFPYPKSWTVDGDHVEFWYSFDLNGTEWYCDIFYGMINIDELKGLDKFSMFINWISNPSEVKE